MCSGHISQNHSFLIYRCSPPFVAVAVWAIGKVSSFETPHSLCSSSSPLWPFIFAQPSCLATTEMQLSNISLNPETPKLSQPQPHEGLDTSTNPGTPKSSQPRSAHCPTPRRTLEHPNRTHCYTTKALPPRNAQIKPKTRSAQRLDEPRNAQIVPTAIPRRPLSKLPRVEVEPLHVGYITALRRTCIATFALS